MTQQKLIKIICRAHSIIENDDGTIDEAFTNEYNCKTLDQLNAFYVEVQNEIMKFNSSQPNRAQRRSRK